jgi:hypothetical protein
MQAELALAQRELEQKGRAIDSDIAHLDEQIRVAEATQNIEQLRAAAHDLDQHGDSPERLRVFERLCTELSAPLVNRFALRSYEARSMLFKRMRRDPSVSFHRAPYASWSELVEVNVRPGQQEAA